MRPRNKFYEFIWSILRPIFKDDEKLVIAVGAILGGIVGEIQVQIMELLGTDVHNTAALPDFVGIVLHR